MSTKPTAKAATMTERPILFSGAMVRALLDGTKTQTRRVCKPANQHALSYVVGPCEERVDLAAGWFGDEEGDLKFACPYGQTGDKLWVRETWAPHLDFPDMANRSVYRADPECKYDVDRWRPSIHMPRRASRILLEITGVRVERLQAISEQDAIAEGIERVENNFGNGPAYCDYGLANTDDTAEWFRSPIRSYETLWESINGAGSWDANPWVWVVEFKRGRP
jgi:hypothetical protein